LFGTTISLAIAVVIVFFCGKSNISSIFYKPAFRGRN
jgi:hypothetical protein